MTLDSLGGTATTLTYNAADRLVQVSAGGVPLVDYVYAATGQRAVKATPTATTHYLYDPGGALQAETDGAGNVLREYITLGGATIAIIDAGGMAFVHDDHLGTPQVMTDGAAAVVWDASYRPFGEASIAGAAANAQRFPGQTADAETGYSDNWHRTYDPSLGRYLQSDPIGLGGGWNTYGYAGGNPVMYMDPTGQFIPVAVGIWWLIGTDAALGVGVYVMTVYAYLEIWEKVQARWAAGCDWSELLTTWEMFEIVMAGRLKWVKSLSGLGKGIGGFGRAGRVGKPPAPTRGGGPGGPGGGGGSGGGGGAGGGGGSGGGGGGGSGGGGGGGGSPVGKGPGGPAGPGGGGNPNNTLEPGSIYVDSKGNAIATPPGGGITGSPDGKYIQARDANGNVTGVRKDGGHNPGSHPDPRAQQPHGHVPGVTNPDGTPWLPIY